MPLEFKPEKADLSLAGQAVPSLCWLTVAFSDVSAAQLRAASEARCKTAEKTLYIRASGQWPFRPEMS